MSKKEKWEIIAREYVVSLFPIFMLVDAFNTVTKKILGKSVDLALILENHSFAGACLNNNWQQVHQLLVGRIKASPNFLRNIFFEIDKKGKRQVDFTKKIFSQNLSKVSNRKLNLFYQQYCQLNTELFGHGLMLPLLDFAKSTFLSDEITKFLKNRNAENYFTLLTTPIKQTMAKRQEIDLYKIILLIEKNREVYNLFSNGGASEIADQLPKLNKTIWQKINNHTRKYTWIYYVYEGPPANQAYFIDLIRDYIRRGVKAKKEILKNEQELSKLKQSQLKILKRLEPNNYERQIILLGRDAVYYKMHRRELQTQSYYYFEPVLSEIGRRLHLTLRQVRTMLPIEIESSLISGLANTEQINQRLKLVCYIRESQKLSVLVGKKANDFTKLIKEKKINKNIKEIHGTTAQEGKVSGAVKVINAPEEMSKMNRGDILVSSATSPNLMPAIRQAAGIITDEGGLTCHAAIVSREFKIPCVVGTGFATRILKDGDMVEVDADKGVVRKI